MKRLQFLPVSLFASVMGIAGLSLAWRTASALFGAPAIISIVIGILALIVFTVICIAYALKYKFYRRNVFLEFRHPLAGNFFGTFPIAVLLLSSVIRPFSSDIAMCFWVAGALLMDTLAFVIMARLLSTKQDLVNATPAWIIPGVGTLDVAVNTGSLSPHWVHEINMLSFSIGSVFAIVFFTLIISRLMHHDPMPERMTPSLMILIAPFSVSFLAYTNIVGEVDLLATVLFYFGLFMFVVLSPKVFNKNLRFMATWWSVGFPIAALTNSAAKYAEKSPGWITSTLALLLLILLNVVVVYMFIRSMLQLMNKRFLQT